MTRVERWARVVCKPIFGGFRTLRSSAPSPLIKKNIYIISYYIIIIKSLVRRLLPESDAMLPSFSR